MLNGRSNRFSILPSQSLGGFIKILTNSEVQRAINTKEIVVALWLDDCSCNPVCLDVGQWNIGTWKVSPNSFCCIPNLILLQHTRLSSFSRKGGVPLGHCRKYWQVKHIHVGHLGRLWLPVPSSGLTVGLHKPQVFSIIVWTSIVALDDGCVPSKLQN